MTFDKSKVYTSLNAEELEIGSEVILANDLDTLKYEVEANSWPTYVKRLDSVMGTSSTNRFKSGDQHYNLAYLVRKVAKEEEQWIAYLARNNISCYLTACREDRWESVQKDYGAKTKLFIGSESEVEEWYKARQKFAKVIKAWEDGKPIQVRVSGKGEWTDCVVTPEWSCECEYRVKPKEEKWIVFLARPKNGNCSLDACEEDDWELAQEDYGAKTKLFIGSRSEAVKWYSSGEKFTEAIKAWEDGKTVQVRDKITNKWVDCAETPFWFCDCEYRAKPENKKLSEKEFKGWKSFKYNADEDLYVVYVDHYGEPRLDFGSCAQWDKIQEYKGAKKKLFVGNREECRAWCDKRDNLAKIILAWENGRNVQFYSLMERRWVTLNNPSWDGEWEYRIEPDGLVWTDLKMGDILRRAGERPAPLGGKHEYVYVEERRMVTGIVDDPGTKRHVQLGGDWIDDDDLKEWSVEE